MNLFKQSITNISLGPWALEAGPKIPEITNQAEGNNWFNNPIKGIDPPIPNFTDGLSKNI